MAYPEKGRAFGYIFLLQILRKNSVNATKRMSPLSLTQKEKLNILIQYSPIDYEN